MVLTLTEALQDPKILHQLRHHPHTFRFPELTSIVVAVEHYPPFLFMEPSGASAVGGNVTISGPLATLLHLLATTMNFTYTTMVSADRLWGNELEDGSWTGMLGLVARKEAHLGLSMFVMTDRRRTAMDFTTSVSVNSCSILARKGSPQVDPWGFLFPLQPEVWVALLLALTMAWVAAVVLGWGSGKVCGQPHTMAAAMFFQHVRALLHQGLTVQVRCGCERVVIGTWMLVSMVVTWSYCSNLMSQLTVRHVPQPIQTLHHVLDDPTLTLIMEPNTAYTDMLVQPETSTLWELRSLQEAGRLRKHPIILDEAWTLNQLTKGDHVVFVDRDSANNFVANYFSQTGRCDLYLGREKLIVTPFGLGMAKGSPLLPAVNHRLSKILAFGLFQQWIENGLNINSTICRSSPSTVTVQERLSLNSLWGMFVILGIGHVLAFVSFCTELMYRCTSVPRPAKSVTP
ncbi:probable glutamate receptor [Panulirus ornatus]|uniref:probable glutamate receptor n=1 Tax=Panulirus ornatus TaxID=150431 RepID=UPI003A872DFD